MRSLINLNLLYNTGICLRKSEWFQKHQTPKRAHYTQDSNFIENNQFINKLLSNTKMAASFGNKRDFKIRDATAVRRDRK